MTWTPEKTMEMLKGNSVFTVALVPGAKNITAPSDANKGHRVSDISADDIPSLGKGGVAGQKEQGSNNEKAKP